MREATPAIRAVRLSKMLGCRTVLRDVDLVIGGGQSVAIVGANGAGKTTLLQCLAALSRPTTGAIFWFGLPAGDSAAKRHIGLVAHDSLLYPHLTLRENLIFAARMHDVPQPRQRVEQLLHDIGLTPHGARLPTAVSRGMRQRVSVARALVHDPQILLLDEPFASLDTEGSRWLENLLQELRARGRTLCFTLHDERAVRRLADRIVEVRAGRAWDVALQAMGDNLSRAA